MSKFSQAGGLAVLAATLSFGTSADTSIVYDIAGGGSQQMDIRDGVVRAGDGNQATVLFNTRTGSFTIIDHSQRSYMELSQADFDRVMNSTERMMAQVERQIAAMPEGQRAQMREMLKKNMPKGMGKEAAAPRRVTVTGETRNVAGVSCQVTEVFRGAQQVAELCMAEHQALGISSEDYEAIRAMHDFSQDMASRAGQFGAKTMDMGDLSGGLIPVSFMGMGDAAQSGSNTLTSVSEADIDPARFEVPAGYRKQEMPQLPF